MPNIMVGKCCPLPIGCYNPWVLGMSNDGYKDCLLFNVSVGSLGSINMVWDGVNCSHGYPAGSVPTINDVDPCHCCVPAWDGSIVWGGVDCDYFNLVDPSFTGWSSNFKVCVSKFGILLTSVTEESNNICSGNAAPICDCYTSYGTACYLGDGQSHDFSGQCDVGDNCWNVFNSKYHHYKNVAPDLTLQIGGIGAYDNAALSIESTDGTTPITTRLVLNNWLVTAADIIDYPGILSAYLGIPPDFGSPFQSDGGGGGYRPWVTLTVTISGITYTYNGYGTGNHAAIWANGIPNITASGSLTAWMGLRLPASSLNTLTGAYYPLYECRRAQTYLYDIGYMPMNSDEWLVFSTTATKKVWKSRPRYYYGVSAFCSFINKETEGYHLTCGASVAATTCSGAITCENSANICDTAHCSASYDYTGDAVNSVTGPLGCGQSSNIGSCNVPATCPVCYSTHTNDSLTLRSVTCDDRPCQEAVSGNCSVYVASTNLIPSIYNTVFNSNDFVWDWDPVYMTPSVCLGGCSPQSQGWAP